MYTRILFFMMLCLFGHSLYAQSSCTTATPLSLNINHCIESGSADTFDDNNVLNIYDSGDDYLFYYDAVGGEILRLNLTSTSIWMSFSIHNDCPENGG